ncbi:MAG TPA: glycosyltransferase [Candidatus Babeliales bacterium]|nr:glycosyltransferase [Candidatus Babeliales bacterium]
MKKIKIVHIITSLKCGGAEALLCELLSIMPQDLFEHHVIYFYHGKHVQTLGSINIPTHQIKGLFCLYDPFFALRLFNKINTIKPDIIHTILWTAHIFGALYARVTYVPIVHALHSHAEVTGSLKNNLFSLPKKLITRLLLTKAQRIITVSDAIAQATKNFYPHYQQSHIITITNGINNKKIEKQAHKPPKGAKIIIKQSSIKNNFFTIGCVGRFIPIKNHQLLINAFAHIHKKHPFTRLILIGYGPLEHDLRQLTIELDIENAVTFIINQNAIHYYSKFDCFVLPSITEGISIALLEAMACKLPCIVTSQEKNHEVITSMENGIITPIHQENLQEAIDLLINNHTLRNILRNNALHTVKELFNIQTASKKYSDLFQNIYSIENIKKN